MYLILKGRGQAPCWVELPAGDNPCGSWVADTLAPADRHPSYFGLEMLLFLTALTDECSSYLQLKILDAPSDSNSCIFQLQITVLAALLLRYKMLLPADLLPSLHPGLGMLGFLWSFRPLQLPEVMC